MQINHHYNAHQLPRPNFGPQRAGSQSETPLGEVTGSADVRRTNLNVYADLLNEVRDDSEVRPVQVALAKAKLEQGTLLTRTAAESAAAAVLREFS